MILNDYKERENDAFYFARKKTGLNTVICLFFRVIENPTTTTTIMIAEKNNVECDYNTRTEFVKNEEEEEIKMFVFHPSSFLSKFFYFIIIQAVL